MTDAYTMSRTLSESAQMHSEALKPPWWRPFKRRYWKDYLQPIDIMRAYHAGLVGEVEPLRQLGVSVRPTVGLESHVEAVERRWLSIIDQVREILT